MICLDTDKTKEFCHPSEPVFAAASLRMSDILRGAIGQVRVPVPPLSRVRQATDPMKIRDYPKDCFQTKRLSPKLCQDDVLRNCLLAPDEAAQEKDLHSFR